MGICYSIWCIGQFGVCFVSFRLYRSFNTTVVQQIRHSTAYLGGYVNGKTYIHLLATETLHYGSFRHHHHRPINIMSNGAAGC
jgi:hypothetical protein